MSAKNQMSNSFDEMLKIDNLGQKYSKVDRKSHNSDLLIIKCCFSNFENPELHQNLRDSLVGLH